MCARKSRGKSRGKGTASRGAALLQVVHNHGIVRANVVLAEQIQAATILNRKPQYHNQSRYNTFLGSRFGSP